VSSYGIEIKYIIFKKIMSYFLYDNELTLDQIGLLAGEEAHHLIHARRIKLGESFELQDHKQERFTVICQKITRHEVHFQVQTQLPAIPPSPLKIDVALGLPKEKTLDWVIQKITELGVSSLSIFIAQYSPKSMASTVQNKAINRWEKIAQTACKQSGRQSPPKILFYKSLQEQLEALATDSHHWILNLDTTTSSWLDLEQIGDNQNQFTPHCVLIGPEGGFHRNELEMAYLQGIQPIYLGPRVLKSETAVIAIVSILQFLYGDLKNS